MQKKQKRTTVNDVINTMTNVGDTLNAKWQESGDLKVCDISIKAYATAISAAKAMLIHKKLTGNKIDLDFFKD
jgi:hypothetical protein